MTRKSTSRRDRAELLRITGLVAIVALLVIGMAPGLATAATTVFDDFEDGSSIGEEWGYTNGNSGYNTTTDSPKEGTYHLRHNTGGGDGTSVIRRTVTAGTYSEFSWYLKINVFSTSSTTDRQPLLSVWDDTVDDQHVAITRVDESGNVLVDSGSTNSEDTGIDISSGSYYRFLLTNIDYSSNTLDLEVYDSSGSLVGSYRNIDFPHGGAANIHTIQLVSGNDDTEFDIDYITDGGTAPVSVSGTVNDSVGSPIEDARVTLYNETSDTNASVTRTDANGDYSFGGVTAGDTYNVTVWKSGYVENATSSFTPNSDITGKDVVLSKVKSDDDSYTQVFHKIDHTGRFPSGESELQVAVWNGWDLTGVGDRPTGAVAATDDWDRVAVDNFNYRDNASAKVDEGNRYRLRVVNTGTADEWTYAGFLANKSHGVLDLEIGVATQEFNPCDMTIAELENQSITFPHEGWQELPTQNESQIDGPYIYAAEFEHEANYVYCDPHNGTGTVAANTTFVGPDGGGYNFDLDIPDGAEYVEGTVPANESLTGVTDPGDFERIDYEYDTGTSLFNGSLFGGENGSDINQQNGSLLVDGGGGAGGGGGGIISPDAGAGGSVWWTLLPAVAAIGYVGYRRFGGGGGGGDTGGAGGGGGGGFLGRGGG